MCNGIMLFRICFTFGTNACRAFERRGPFQNAAHFGRHKRRIAAQLPHGTLSVFPIPCIWLSEQRTDQKRRREGLSRHFYLPLIFCVFVRKRQSEGCVALLNSAKKKSYAFVIHYTWEESRFNLKLEESGAIINKPDPRTLFFNQRKKVSFPREKVEGGVEYKLSHDTPHQGLRRRRRHRGSAADKGRIQSLNRKRYFPSRSSDRNGSGRASQISAKISKSVCMGKRV